MDIHTSITSARRRRRHGPDWHHACAKVIDMDFSALTAYLDSLETQAGVPACDLSIYKDHREIYRHRAGWRDHEKTIPLQGDETYCLYSCSKLFTTCAAMQLIEREQLGLDDPVSRYLPAYAHMTVRCGDEIVPAQTPITIRHLMSMQSGMDYETSAPEILAALEKYGEHASTRQLVDAMAAHPLHFEPGTDFLYSLSHDVLAAVIEVVSGMSFSEYLKKNIWEPLELKTIGFTLPGQDMARMCAQYAYDAETGKLRRLPAAIDEDRFTDAYESGGAGLISDVKSYVTFADALACGGVGSTGAKILSPEMIQLWTANQLPPKSRRAYDEWNRTGSSYALGVRTRVDLTKGGPGSVGEFGWDGAAGAWTMVDPYTNVSAFYAMHIRFFDYNYDVIHPQIRNLIYEGLAK